MENLQENIDLFSLTKKIGLCINTKGQLLRTTAAWQQHFANEENNFLSLVHKDDGILVKEALQKIHDSKHDLVFCCRCTDKKGRIRHFYWQGEYYAEQAMYVLFSLPISPSFTPCIHHKEQKQQLLLESLAKINATLFTTRYSSNAVEHTLSFLGKLVEAETVFIYKHSTDNTEIGNAYLKKCFFWSSKVLPAEQKFENIAYEKYFPDTYHQLLDNKVISDELENTPFITCPTFLSLKVCSLLLVPIYINKNYWGIIGLAHNNEVGFQDKNNTILLRSVGVSIHGALHNERNEQQLQNIINHIPVVLFTLDKAGNFTFIRGQGLQTFGLRSEVTLGQSALEYYRYYPDVITDLKTVLKGNSFANTLYFSKSVFDVHYTPLFNEHGECSGALIVAIDSTKHEQREHELSCAKEAAEEASRLKSDFLATMSHEIRTPMNGVIGMTDLLLTSELNTQQQRYVETIKNSGKSLLEVINDILDFSKIEAGKLRLEATDFDLRNLLEEIINLFSTTADNKRLILRYEISEKTPISLRGDSGRLRQILNNLISNALKFTHEGEVCIHVSSPEHTQSKVSLHIQVTDTGIGISPEMGEKLFHPFSQAEDSITRRYGGTGLGLAITRRLVQMMQGEIGVISEKGEGTTFWFNIVLMYSHKQRKPIFEEPNSYSLPQHHLLVIEDNNSHRDTLVNTLRNWKIHSDLAATAEQGLALLQASIEKNKCYDTLIIDYLMSDMNGLHLIEQIRTFPEYQHTPIVLSVPEAYEIEDDIHNIKYLQKPIDNQYLQHCLSSTFTHPVSNAPSRLKKKESTSHFPMWHILLAEDNEVNQEVAKGMLERLNCAVDIAVNGKDAVSKMINTPYHLIFMDCHMPVMDGFSASQKIRDYEAQQQCSRVPIIALTASAMQGDRERCLNAGMDDYLTKPFVRKDLKHVLQQWLDISNKTVTPKEKVIKNNEDKTLCVLDKKVLRQIKEEINGQSIVWLIDLFLQELPNYIQAITESLQEKDCDALYLAAHKLKGASANLGAKQLVAFCAELELQASQKCLVNTNEMIASLKSKGKLLQTELDIFIEEEKTSSL